MSLPPQVIKVKRKRTEEGPVPSFLRIEHSTKRHRGDAFLYRRHDPAAAALLAAQHAAAAAEAEARSTRAPTIHASQPGDEKRRRGPATPTKTIDTITTTKPGPTTHRPIPISERVIAEPRRFHLSRASLLVKSDLTSPSPVDGLDTGSSTGGVRKRSRFGASGPGPNETAVFVERSKTWKARTRSQTVVGKTSARGLGRDAVDGSATLRTDSTAEAAATVSPPVAPAPLPKLPLRRLANKASNLSTYSAYSASGDADPATAPAPAPISRSSTPALPPSLSNRQWNTNMEQLTREMNDYTLEVIGRNLAQMQESARTEEAKRSAERERAEMDRMAHERRKAANAKFKPKPGPRYADRLAAGDVPMGETEQTEQTEPTEQGDGDDAEMGDVDGTGSETDEDDYVTETYVRIPGHEAAQAQAGASGVPATIGLLVFDNEPDMEYFYGVEDESEDEFEDDEDENAENYYAHDYPEDEVSSDDEFDRDPYLYRTSNASDLEEFSDGEDEDLPVHGGPFGAGFSGVLSKPGGF